MLYTNSRQWLTSACTRSRNAFRLYPSSLYVSFPLLKARDGKYLTDPQGISVRNPLFIIRVPGLPHQISMEVRAQVFGNQPAPAQMLPLFKFPSQKGY
jgi:hypothetical protein